MELTPRQIKMMKHAIGFSNQKNHNGSYDAYRNYYDVGKSQTQEWERLVSDGLAASSQDNYGNIIYRVSEKGASVLSGILEINITL